MTERVPLVYNPRAGGGSGRKRAARTAERLEARGLSVDLQHTSGPGGALPLAESLARDGHDRILVIGGDGTHSEAVEGVIRSGRGADVALGLLPGGTGNDTLRDFDLRDPERAADAAAKGSPHAMDAALARWEGGERYFMNVFGTGFVAKVCDLANRRLKWIGERSYTVAVFPELARLASPPTRLVVDGETVDGRFACVMVCNTQYAGNAMHFAPMAKPDDGLLEVVLLEDVSRARLVRIFTKLFKAAHLDAPEVRHYRARSLHIAPGDASPLIGDGEVYGSTPVDVDVVPRAWRMLR